jgi:hypothetical protein
VFIVIAEAADYFIGGRKYDWLIAVPVMVALCLVILLGMRPSDADKYRAFQSHAIDWGLGCFFGGLRYQARLSTGVSLAGSEASAIMHQPRSAFS